MGTSLRRSSNAPFAVAGLFHPDHSAPEVRVVRASPSRIRPAPTSGPLARKSLQGFVGGSGTERGRRYPVDARLGSRIKREGLASELPRSATRRLRLLGALAGLIDASRGIGIESSLERAARPRIAHPNYRGTLMSTQTMIASDELFIGGEWIKPQGSGRIAVLAASTEEPVGSVPDGTNADIDAGVRAARAAFDDPSGWSSWSSEDRAQALERLAGALESRGEETARRVSLQNGMPISLALQVEAVFPSVVARYYAGLIRETPLQEDRAGLLGGTIHVLRKPVGVVGAIVPWNYPQTLAMFKLAPLLASGCTVVMKPSPETVLDSLLLAEAIIEAGLPSGVVNIVPAGREVGAYLVEHPDVDKIAFTGASASGRMIARRCGGLR